MNAFRLAAIALLFLLGLGPAHATCPYGNTYDDGCSGAPTDGNFQQSDFFTYAKQSGQGSYYNGSSSHVPSAHPPGWNIPGADYPLGYSLAAVGGSLKDPSVDALPSGCAYSSSGSVLGGAIVVCSNGGTINGWDFSLHNCIPLRFAATATAVVITNSKFQMGTNCSLVQGIVTASLSGTTLTMTALVSGSAPSVGQIVQNVNPNNLLNTSTTKISSVTSAWNGTTGTYVVDHACTTSCGSQNFYLGNVQGWLINLTNAATASFDFEDNYVNGDETNFPMAQTGCLFIDGNSGSLKFKYNAFTDCGRPETSNSYGDDLWEYNYIDTFARSVNDGHGEVDFHSWKDQTSTNTTYSFNTILLGSGAAPIGSTTLLYPTAQSGGSTSAMTNVTGDHNVFVGNTNGGTRTTAAVTFEFDGTTAYTTRTLTGNFFDPTGALFAVGSVDGDNCAITFSGNVNMLNGHLATSCNNIP